jgi:peptidoglycan/LPS O-acetylase OafA/YrhL
MMNKPFDTTGNNLDFLRLLLAVTVIFSHSFPLGMGPNYPEPLLTLTHGQSSAGTAAVNAFFVISGFLITNSFLRSRSIWGYFRKRIARIYPGFVVCMVLCVVIVVPISGAHFVINHLPNRIADFAIRTLLLGMPNITDAFSHNPLGGNTINGSVWSIPWEFACYIALAVLGVIGILKRRSIVLLLFGLSVAYFVASAILAWTGCLHANAWLHLLDTHPYIQRRGVPGAFLAGVTFYMYRDRIPHSTWLALCAGFALVASCFISHTWVFASQLAGTYLIFWFGFHPRINLHHFARYGDFSYGTYLYAFTVQQLIVHWIGHSARPLVLFASALVPSLALGVLSWYCVERWFLSSRRKHGVDSPILPSSPASRADKGVLSADTTVQPVPTPAGLSLSPNSGGPTNEVSDTPTTR